MRTRVKICGVTRTDDVAAVARSGADAFGLVFDPKSPRYVLLNQAAELARAAPPFVTVVGLFVDASPAQIWEILSTVRITLLQFHGSETPEQCRLYKVPYMKAIRMQDGVDVRAQARAYGDAAGLLLDSYSPSVAGGSGKTFDWSRIPRDLERPVILAGGLTSDNVAAAIRTAQPYAVDVSSGVEFSKGVKDAAKIDAFVRAVREAT